jgi:hypothetical protein
VAGRPLPDPQALIVDYEGHEAATPWHGCLRWLFWLTPLVWCVLANRHSGSRRKTALLKDIRLEPMDSA